MRDSNPRRLMGFRGQTAVSSPGSETTEAVTREAADKLAECFKKLVARRVERTLAQRFILQTLVVASRGRLDVRRDCDLSMI